MLKRTDSAKLPNVHSSCYLNCDSLTIDLQIIYPISTNKNFKNLDVYNCSACWKRVTLDFLMKLAGQCSKGVQFPECGSLVVLGVAGLTMELGLARNRSHARTIQSPYAMYTQTSRTTVTMESLGEFSHGQKTWRRMFVSGDCAR